MCQRPANQSPSGTKDKSTVIALLGCQLWLNYNPEMVDTLVIQILMLEDTLSWSGSWDRMSHVVSPDVETISKSLIWVSPIDRSLYDENGWLKGLFVVCWLALTLKAHSFRHCYWSLLFWDANIYRRPTEIPSLVELGNYWILGLSFHR